MNLYDYCKEQKIEINLACEVGFWRLADSQIKEFIEEGVVCMIIDVLPATDEIQNKMNVGYHCYGIGFRHETRQRFNKFGASTYMADTNSPVVINKNHKPKAIDAFYRDVFTFDKFDHGTIDIISIDIEGMEWAVLCNMISLPKIIEVEMEWKKYINPYYETIKHWMKINGYKFLERDGSDYIYIRTT